MEALIKDKEAREMISLHERLVRIIHNEKNFVPNMLDIHKKKRVVIKKPTMV